MESNFPIPKDYRAPSPRRIGELMATEIIDEITAIDPNSEIDNRDAIRVVLYNLTDGIMDKESMDALTLPYDIGFYKKADGKSTPLRWFRVNRLQRRLGIRKDVVSIRHDYDYYSGQPRNIADRDFRRFQKLLRSPAYMTFFEYQALRIFGARAWTHHEYLRLQSAAMDVAPKYGTVEYIPYLPDTPPLKLRGSKI